jgi:hypothetical protein
MSDFSFAPEVRKVADPLIEAHHRHLLRYAVPIIYLFTDKPKKEKGKVAWGYVQKVAGIPAFLALVNDAGESLVGIDEFFVMVLDRVAWCEMLSDRQKKALVDHELCHLFAEIDEKTGNVSLSLRPHDVEEFGDVLARHGRWSRDVEILLKKMQKGPQLSFEEIARHEEHDSFSREGITSVTLTGKEAA